MRHSIQPSNHFDEFHLLVKGFELLALVTGVVYLSVVTGDLFLGLIAGSVRADTTVLFILLLVATGSLLFASARWEAAGGVVATVCGLGISIIVYTTAKENHLMTAFVYGSPFILTGILSLVNAWRNRGMEGG